MKSRITTTVALTLGLALSTAAQAYDRGAGDAYYDYARVVSVVPVTRLVTVSEPRRECWEQPVTRYHQRRAYRGGGDSYTPSILGGILGGVAGNQFGKGSGNTAMTIAGTVLGASLGRDVQHAGRAVSEPYTTTEVRCETHDDYREVEQPDGYRVTYRYQGQEFSRHMDYDPGSRVRVRVSVDPLVD